MEAKRPTLRVGIYGAGNWANATHIPNLLGLGGVEVAAICDRNLEAARATAARFGIAGVYEDGHQMLAQVELDALFSVVPAFARSGVEEAAAARGVHLFSEKPQALNMETARRIDAAIRRAGVLSTVCFRERYRPIFQEARRRLQGKQVAHIRFQSIGGLPPLAAQAGDSWWHQLDKSGGAAFDWGVHAVDYARFVSGLEIARAQAFYTEAAAYALPLSYSFNFQLSNGGTMSMNFVAATPAAPPGEARFVFFFEGGYLAIHGYEYLEVNGEKVYHAAEFNPWYEQDRCFIEAIRTGDASLLLNDYHDGLFSLGPVLAGWQSARQGGACLDVSAFMKA
ncbi:MAG: Gfo/Idh/MocA family oxidoreductase [Candidatus Latescibacteria bacterium]|nr:Gfo/Idh/MocA family oxidoreductase [Candidatus Latescibacterota bacterium]